MTSLTLDQAQVLINDRFITQWAARTPFALTNENSLANEVTTSWVWLNSKLGFSGQHTLGKSGARRYERRGIIFAQVFTPVNTGSKPAVDLAKAIEDIFEGVTFNGVSCFNSIIKEIGVDGQWYQLQVQIEFLFEETK